MLLTGSKDFNAILTAPFGRLGVRTEDDAIVDIKFVLSERDITQPHHDETPAIGVLRLALAAYWRDASASLAHVPVKLQGTAHQLRVWQALTRIRPGETRCYGEVAVEMGSAAQAVGQACGANPLPLLIPCHRVVSRTGLGGFMQRRNGEALFIKQWLLTHERRRTH